MTNDQLSAEFDRIRDKLYHEQPDTMSTISDLIDLLQMAHCEHRFETKLAKVDSPDGPAEYVTICAKCGMEEQE